MRCRKIRTRAHTYIISIQGGRGRGADGASVVSFQDTHTHTNTRTHHTHHTYRAVAREVRMELLSFRGTNSQKVPPTVTVLNFFLFSREENAPAVPKSQGTLYSDFYRVRILGH